MEVLERDHDGRLGAEAVQEAEHRLEQAALRGGVGLAVRGRRAGQPGEETGELGAGARIESVEGGMAGAGEGPERRHERGVGQLALAELDAVAAQDLRAGSLGAIQQLADQARLPDARVTRYEGERRPAFGSVGQSRLELLELGRPADQPAARDPRGHATSIARARRRHGRSRRRGRG